MLVRTISLFFRTVVAFAAAGMVACSLILVIEAGINAFAAAQAVLNHDESRSISLIMKAIDECLFGVILILLGAKVLASFVLPEEMTKPLPAWMQASDIGELKNTFCQTILVYLIVDFATDMATLGSKTDYGFLVLPTGILLIAAALKLMPHSAAAPSGH